MSTPPQPKSARRIAANIAGGALVVMGGLVAIGAASDDDDEAVEQPRAEVVAPRTVERVVEVEVEVPTMPQACIEYTQMVTDVTEAIYAYEQEIAPFRQILTDASMAMALQDPVALNGVKSRQTDVMNNSTGPLQEIIGADIRLQTALADCVDAQEE